MISSQDIFENPISLCVYGRPVAKPRMTRRDKFLKRKCVMKYREWSDKIRYTFTKKTGVILTHKNKIKLTCPVKIEMCFQFYKKNKNTYHTEKPDIDNLNKGVLDSLFDNDQYVVSITSEKYFVSRLMNEYANIKIKAIK